MPPAQKAAAAKAATPEAPKVDETPADKPAPAAKKAAAKAEKPAERKWVTTDDGVKLGWTE